MPELGIGLHQRCVQRQVLRQIQMYVLPENLIDPFRTDEEQVQISQYEVIKNLLATIEKGEFIDQDHFNLEINRTIFGKTLEARLGNFGKDISAVVKAYGANENTASRILALLIIQKELGDKKDIPGQIAASLKNISSSRYFNQKSKDDVLNLLGDIYTKDVDIASSMDIIANAALAKDQINLVNASINKIREYAERDSRIIPFAQNLLLPIFRVIGKRRENLNYDESKAVYENLVESLYMLDRELSVPGAIEKISDSLNKNGIKAITESRLPVPIQVCLESILLEEPDHKKAMELCDDYAFKQGRELKRKVYKGLAILEELENPKEIFRHILDNVSDSNGLARILSAISLVYNDPEFKYPYELNTEESILKNLKLHLVDKSIKRIGLNDQNLERYLEKIESDGRFGGIGNITTTLAGYEHYQNDRQISLIREIIIAELDGKFNEWRYSHDLAGRQLAVLNGSTGSWKENRKNVRIVGEIEALNAHINSVKNVLPKIFELYSEYYGRDFNKDEHINLGNKIKKNEDELRNGHSKSESKEIGYQTSLLREQLNYVTLLHDLEELNKDNYESTLQLAEKILKKKSKNPLYESARWIRETLDQPVYRDARKINIYETDDLEALLRFGEKPVPHCQNWKSNSRLNRSLLSFVADANKKLYHIADSNGKLISMSIVRLVDWNSKPTILIENVYDVEWSDDYGVALFGNLADKALSMYEETDKEIRVATNNSRLLDAMKKFSKKYNVEIRDGAIHTKPAPSKNTYEYWDCGPGLVNSESEVSLNVNFISFGRE